MENGDLMASSDSLLGEKERVETLVREKLQIEKKLASAGGKDFNFLLDDCANLMEIIDEVEDITRKKDQKQHAAYATKVKFSRKIRHRAKDMDRFERSLAREYEDKHISLEHGRKMVAILALLKSSNISKARQEAEEFSALLEMGGRLEIIKDELARKQAQIKRAKREVDAQLGTLRWLGSQPPLDRKKIDMHEERLRLLDAMEKIRLEKISSLQSMPAVALLQELGAENIAPPELRQADAGALIAFLAKEGLASKTAGQILELDKWSDEKLRYAVSDLKGFRSNVGKHRSLLFRLSELGTPDFLPLEEVETLEFLARHSKEGLEASRRLSELGRSARECKEEWEKLQEIEGRKALAGGLGILQLEKSLAELEGLLEAINAEAVSNAKVPEERKGGLIDSILGFFGRK